MRRKQTVLGLLSAAAAVAVTAAIWLGSEPPASAQNVRTPGEMFRYEVAANESEILIDFDVAEGGYLYRERFGFESGDARVTLGATRFPAGEMHSDEFFGEQEIYREEFRIAIPYSRSAAVESVDVVMSLQGCDDIIGLCYPPQDWTAAVDIPDAAPVAAAGGLAGSLFAGAESDEPLPVDQAFVGNLRFDSANELTAAWQIAPGYYLYRDQFTFAVDGEIQLDAAVLPAGVAHNDENYGDVEIYRNNVELIVPFARAHPDSQELTITVGYQGCKDESICYPPSEQVFELILPASSELAASATAPAMISEQDRFSALITGDSWFAFLGTFYIAGLALSLTPCVLPMVPILSSIIAGQGSVSTRRGFMLSLSYVLGMAVTYTAAGALAALAGSQVQAIFQKPWIIASFAGLFVVMALGMFGLFELQMPSAIQTRLSQIAGKQRGGTFFSTAVIGALTALIVTTCVAPPLIGALAVIGQTGDVTRGAAALFVLSIGMGTPLLLVGASAGRLLPRVGPWMNTVKIGFGIVMIGMAIYMLDRVLPGPVTLLLWALLVFLTGVFLGAFDALPQEATPFRRLTKGVAVLVCLYGALMFIGSRLGGEDPFTPIPPLSGGLAGAPQESGPEFIALESVAQLETLLGQARAANQPVMVDFTADWCISCKEMENYTFPDPAVIAALEPYLLLRADVTENDAEDKALLDYFGIIGPPTMAFFDRGGRELDPYRLVGYVEADEFAPHVTAVADM